jgi:DNA mismatch endonuclease, patch repair protein
MDKFTPEERSRIMSKIRGKNTSCERIVYSYLRKNKIYFQKHYRTKQGIVLDVALPRKKRAVFIDGDFWHGRTYEKVLARRGKDDFWTKKLERNIERDQQQAALLEEAGWQILRVWESELTRKASREASLLRIAAHLTDG